MNLRELENKLDENVQQPKPKPEEWYKLCESSSGASSARGAAAVAARLLGLSKQKIWEALGIAEYYRPRSMMMRCIAQPTMLKDGAGMGAYAGTSAAILAKKGFTGASPETIDDSDISNSIGSTWLLNKQYYKKFAVCYWSQCSMQGALDCLHALNVKHHTEETAKNVKSVKISTFQKAVSMNHPHPSTTEIAQYSLKFAVAAVIRYGHVGASEVISLDDHTVSVMSGKIVAEEKSQYTDKYPDQRLADVEVVMNGGTNQTKTSASAASAPLNEVLPTVNEFKDKFLANLDNVVSKGKANYLYDTIMSLEKLSLEEVGNFLDVLEQ